MAATLPQKKVAMVGPDLDIFKRVNNALSTNGLTTLSLPEFLRLFNTMKFKEPFNCVNLKEMVELAEMVEEADHKKNLSSSEIFGFSCAPVNLGLLDHVQSFLSILTNFVSGRDIHNEENTFCDIRHCCFYDVGDLHSISFNCFSAIFNRSRSGEIVKCLRKEIIQDQHII